MHGLRPGPEMLTTRLRFHLFADVDARDRQRRRRPDPDGCGAARSRRSRSCAAISSFPASSSSHSWARGCRATTRRLDHAPRLRPDRLRDAASQMAAPARRARFRARSHHGDQSRPLPASARVELVGPALGYGDAGRPAGNDSANVVEVCTRALGQTGPAGARNCKPRDNSRSGFTVSVRLGRSRIRFSRPLRCRLSDMRGIGRPTRASFRCHHQRIWLRAGGIFRGGRSLALAIRCHSSASIPSCATPWPPPRYSGFLLAWSFCRC